MTGNGTHIGEAIAKVIAKQDAKVEIAGRWKDESERIRRDIERKGGQGLELPGASREGVAYESS